MCWDGGTCDGAATRTTILEFSHQIINYLSRILIFQSFWTHIFFLSLRSFIRSSLLIHSRRVGARFMSIGGCIVCLFCCRLTTTAVAAIVDCFEPWCRHLFQWLFFYSIHLFLFHQRTASAFGSVVCVWLDFFYYYIQFCFNDYSSEWVWWLICCFCGNYNLIIWAFYTCYIEWEMERDIHIT